MTKTAHLGQTGYQIDELIIGYYNLSPLIKQIHLQTIETRKKREVN